MSKFDDGGPAFPRPASEFTKNGTLHDGNTAEESQDGMSLRDYFAAKIGAAIIAYSAIGEEERWARRAYYFADMLLAARKPKPEKAQ